MAGRPHVEMWKLAPLVDRLHLWPQASGSYNLHNRTQMWWRGWQRVWKGCHFFISITLDEKFVEKQKTTLVEILLQLQFSLMATVSWMCIGIRSILIFCATIAFTLSAILWSWMAWRWPNLVVWFFYHVALAAELVSFNRFFLAAQCEGWQTRFGKAPWRFLPYFHLLP